MPAFIDRSGAKIGRLTVIKLIKLGNKKYWECTCDCDRKIINIPKDSLSRSKTTLSCGCIQKEAAIKTGHNNTFKERFGNSKHGLYKHPLYRCHQAMIYRCYHQDSQSYEHYGGRGIKVCKRWKGLNGLKNFIEDMYGTFQKGLELDRKNNNGNYEPNNCRWATNKEQLNNTRFNRTLLVNGKRLTIAEASLIYNIKATTILSRINRNWTHNKAVLTPPTDKFKKKKDKKWQHYHINPLRNAAKMLILFTLGVKKTVFNGMTYGLSQNGYDIRIAEDLILYPVSFKNLILKALGFKRPSFALAYSIENFNMPLDLKFTVADKSSWARLGLAAQNTIGEAGWGPKDDDPSRKNTLTLELTNHGDEIIRIKAGSPIAQIIFDTLDEPTEKGYKGKYSGQPDKAVESIHETTITEPSFNRFKDYFDREEAKGIISKGL